MAETQSPTGYEPEIPRGGKSIAAEWWPYVLFASLAVIYNYLFLGQGFNGTDEGYLLSLGQRVASGDRPYIDFYFLRTPLSIYIQAGLIEIFGDSYTVLASRIFWAVQIGVLALLLSTVYRKFVSAMELFFLLVATYIILGLLVSFPWYNTDAAFFAGLAVVLFYHQYLFWAGMAIGLAFLTKQGYGLMLPLFLAIAGIIQWRFRRIRLIGWRIVIRLCLGAALPVLIYVIYLLFNRGLGRFIENVLLLPPKSSGVGITFTLFQNNLDALLYSIPIILAIIIVFLAPIQKRVWMIAGGVCFAVAVFLMFKTDQYYVFNIVMMNYAVAAIAIIMAAKGTIREDQVPIGKILSAMIMAAVAQYIAGYNYGGLAFVYVGAGISICFTYLVVRAEIHGGHGKLISIGLLSIILAIGAYHKHNAVYRDEKRTLLTSEFTLPKLKGIKSTERNVRQIEGMISIINQYTSKGDYIYVFPDLPVLYYLTDRKNPTPVEWPFFRELTGEIIVEMLDSLQSRMPKIVLLEMYPEADFRRVGKKFEFYGFPKYKPFIDFFYSQYNLLKEEGDVFILTPVRGKN